QGPIDEPSLPYQAAQVYGRSQAPEARRRALTRAAGAHAAGPRRAAREETPRATLGRNAWLRAAGIQNLGARVITRRPRVKPPAHALWGTGPSQPGSPRADVRDRPDGVSSGRIPRKSGQRGAIGSSRPRIGPTGSQKPPTR